MRRQRRDYQRAAKDEVVALAIEKIVLMYETSGFSEELIQELKALRERFIELELPTIVKTIRLTYEHVQQFGHLNIEVFEEEEVEEEETEEVEGDLFATEDDEVEEKAPETVPVSLLEEGEDAFLHLIMLIKNPANKYNREEIRIFADTLKAILY